MEIPNRQIEILGTSSDELRELYLGDVKHNCRDQNNKTNQTKKCNDTFLFTGYIKPYHFKDSVMCVYL